MDGGFDFNFLFASEGNASQNDAPEGATNNIAATIASGLQTDVAGAEMEHGLDFFLDAFAQHTETTVTSVVPCDVPEATEQAGSADQHNNNNKGNENEEEAEKYVSNEGKQDIPAAAAPLVATTAEMKEDKKNTCMADVASAELTNKQSEMTVSEAPPTRPAILQSAVQAEQQPAAAAAATTAYDTRTHPVLCATSQAHTSVVTRPPVPPVHSQPVALPAQEPQQQLQQPQAPLLPLPSTCPTSASNANMSMDELSAQVTQLIKSVAPLVQQGSTRSNEEEEEAGAKAEEENAEEEEPMSDADFAQLAGQLLRQTAQSRTEAARSTAQLQMKAVTVMQMLGPHAGLASILGKEYAATPMTNLVPLLIPLLQELLSE